MSHAKLTADFYEHPSALVVELVVVVVHEPQWSYDLKRAPHDGARLPGPGTHVAVRCTYVQRISVAQTDVLPLGDTDVRLRDVDGGDWGRGLGRVRGRHDGELDGADEGRALPAARVRVRVARAQQVHVTRVVGDLLVTSIRTQGLGCREEEKRVPYSPVCMSHPSEGRNTRLTLTSGIEVH